VRLPAILLVIASTAFATGASAQVAPPVEAADLVAPPGNVDRREGMWRIESGYRGSFVTSSGYDPFSTDGYFPEFSLAASRLLFARGRFSFAAGLAWDFGHSAATARGDTSSFDMQRFTVLLEGRIHFGPWGYAYARAAPGATMEHAEIGDESSPALLEKTQWLFATDLSAGYAWLVWPRGEESLLEPRIWLQGEGGYGWVAQERLALAPALPSGSLERATGVDLGNLSMQGAFFRVAAAVTF
jgi:hypothetical protein